MSILFILPPQNKYIKNYNSIFIKKINVNVDDKKELIYNLDIIKNGSDINERK